MELFEATRVSSVLTDRQTLLSILQIKEQFGAFRAKFFGQQSAITDTLPKQFSLLEVLRP